MSDIIDLHERVKTLEQQMEMVAQLLDKAGMIPKQEEEAKEKGKVKVSAR